MPSFSNMFLSLGLALALTPFAAAAPTAETNNQTITGIDVPEVTFEWGTYNSDDPISRRTAPAGCNFEGTRGDFSYYKINTFGGDPACIGYENWYTCSEKWGHEQILDIHAAMILLVAKDGWKSTAESGDWKSNFFLGTTAFKNRDTSFMEEGLMKFPVGPTIIYWSRGSDMATVQTGMSTCKKNK